MFRFRLRTLLIVLALCPPLLAGAWWVVVLDGLNPTAANGRRIRQAEERERRAWENALKELEHEREKRRGATESRTP